MQRTPLKVCVPKLQFSLLQSVQTGCFANPCLLLRVYWVPFSEGVERPEREADYLPPSTVEVRMIGATRVIWLCIAYSGILTILTFRHRASCILRQAFRYSPENAFYIFNQQIYFII